MADDRMALLETMRKAIADGDADFLREGVKALAEAVMEAEVTELTGVSHGERDPERRLTHRNGYRERRWDTRVGTVELAIPRVRDGSYLPSLIEPRRRAERALLAVVQEAYVLGVSTRRVEDLVEALGITTMSKSQVSRICAALDTEVEAFRNRSLAGETYPYLWLDATYVKVRDDGRVMNMAALVAIGVSEAGRAPHPGSGPRPRQHRGRCLVGLHRWPRGTRPGRGQARHQRSRWRPRQGRPRATPRSIVAEVSRPFHAQRTGSRAALGPGHRGHLHPLHLRSARRGQCPGPAAASRRWARAKVPEGRRAAHRGRDRPASCTSPSLTPTVPGSDRRIRSSG